MLPHHTHTCQECGHESTYHVHDHEAEGDQVTAYCGECDRDTTHTIGGFVA